MKDLFKGFILFLSTGAFTGYAPIASGTVGSLVGVALFFPLSHLSILLYLVTVTAFTFLAIWSADQAQKLFEKQDPSEIVIDEIAGFLVAMAALPCTWQFVTAGFILFRIFDIIKPFPGRWIDKNIHGGVGIVLDDIVAGVYANVVLQAVRLIS